MKGEWCNTKNMLDFFLNFGANHFFLLIFPANNNFFRKRVFDLRSQLYMIDLWSTSWKAFQFVHRLRRSLKNIWNIWNSLVTIIEIDGIPNRQLRFICFPRKGYLRNFHPNYWSNVNVYIWIECVCVFGSENCLLMIHSWAWNNLQDF